MSPKFKVLIYNRKRQHPATVGTMQLDSTTSLTTSSFVLFANPMPCFMIPICLGSQKIKTYIFIDSRASACFIDESSVKLHKIQLTQKTKVVHIEVIDRRPLAFSSVTHETIFSQTDSTNHSS